MVCGRRVTQLSDGLKLWMELQHYKVLFNRSAEWSKLLPIRQNYRVKIKEFEICALGDTFYSDISEGME